MLSSGGEFPRRFGAVGRSDNPVGARAIEVPKALKGAVLTDDFARADVYGAYGRRYRPEK